MKRRRIILAIMMATVAATVGLMWPRGPREPVYQGKRLTEWIPNAPSFYTGGTHMKYLEDRATAERAFQSMGTNALTWLMSEFTQPESKWRAAINRWVAKHTRWGFRLDDRRMRIQTASVGLQFLGSSIAPALPELAQHLGDRQYGGSVAQAMAAAGPPALPHLAGGINSRNELIEFNSLYGLVNLAREVESAVPPMLQALSSTSATVRLVAAGNLSEVRFHPELTIPALSAAMSDPDAQVGRNAGSALTSMRWNSAPLVAELHRQMQDTNPSVVLTASNALHLLQTTNEYSQPRR